MEKENQKGQSLIEILIATAIGAIIIASVAGLLISILKLNSDANNIQASAGLAKETLGEVQNFSQSNWYNIYNLAKDGTAYYLVATGTTFQAATGTESVAIAQSDISTGLVGNWKFDESTGTYAFDSSGNSNLGIVYYATRQTGSSCVSEGCLSFNGTSSYVAIPYINAGGTLTYAIWINVGTSSLQRFFSSGSTLIQINAGNTSMEFFPNINSGATYNANYNFNIGKWYHIVATQTDSTSTVYVNGVSLGSQATQPIHILNQVNSIGKYNTQYAQDIIDDVRIYNTALSSTTISNLYKAQFYTRDFTVANVNRDANGNITSGSGSDDPSTQLVNIYYNWPNGSTSTLPIYLTRYPDQVTYQNDWSGGAGQTGPLTIPNNLFSSSTFIDYTSSTGAIIIKGF